MSIDQLENYQKYFEKSALKVILQRFLKYKFMAKIPEMSDDDDEIIQVSRGEPVNKEVIDKIKGITKFQDSEQKEEEKIPELKPHITEEMSDRISDVDFKRRCSEAKKQCRYYARIFFWFERISKVFETACVMFPIVVTSVELTLEEVVAAVVVFLVVMFLNSFGDWSRLREKYSNLHHLFSKLSKSKSTSRISDFKKYSVLFGSDNLFIDTIILDHDKEDEEIEKMV